MITLLGSRRRLCDGLTRRETLKAGALAALGGFGHFTAEIDKLLKRLDEGDVMIVTRLDRLARSTRDLLNILDTVAKAGAGFRSLADTWADTTTPHGRLMLTVLGGLAEFERELIRARTGEGRKRAGPWRQVRSPTKAQPAPAPGGHRALAERRDAGRYCTDFSHSGVL